MKTPESIRHLRIAIILVLSVLVLGTIGYMLIEQFSFADALYTTVDMMATVGSMIRPLSSAGRMFSIIVIVLGVGSLLYTFGAYGIHNRGSLQPGNQEAFDGEQDCCVAQPLYHLWLWTC